MEKWYSINKVSMDICEVTFMGINGEAFCVWPGIHLNVRFWRCFLPLMTQLLIFQLWFFWGGFFSELD